MPARLIASTGEPIANRMRAFGARVHRVEGNYEASLAACRGEAEARGWRIVQDVDWEGYQEVPRRIFEGYTVLSAEMVEQVAAAGAPPPTHVFVNTGVGGLACAVCAHLWTAYGAARPRFVVVEPRAAACCLHSARQGRCATLPPEDEEVLKGTVQVGLDCKEPAPLAWRVLAPGAADFVSIGDECVAPCVQLLEALPAPLHAGKSAVASLGAVVAAAAQPELRARLGLSPDSRVALIVCEGRENGGAS